MIWPTSVEAVTITIGGVTYEGTFYVQRSVVYVLSSFGVKATPFVGAPPEVIAKMLLSAMVRAGTSTD